MAYKVLEECDMRMKLICSEGVVEMSMGSWTNLGRELSKNISFRHLIINT